MKPEDKQLLLADLCARLPYGVQCEVCGLKYGPYTFTGNDIEDLMDGRMFKPYLRPMSSMTEEEREEFNHLYYDVPVVRDGGNVYRDVKVLEWMHIDWYNTNHFDYRGLIPKGLALEVTKENNPYK